MGQPPHHALMPSIHPAKIFDLLVLVFYPNSNLIKDKIPVLALDIVERQVLFDLHSDWLLEFADLLDLIHQVPSINKLHHKIETILKSHKNVYSHGPVLIQEAL